MALTERLEYDCITILLNGVMQLRTSRVILDNDVEIARTHHRRVLEPDMPLSDVPAGRVRALCNFVWTPQTIADYQAWKAAQMAAR